MARVTVEDCIDKVESPYELVLVAKERATQLNSGLEPTLDRDNDKNTVISLREIAEEKIQVKDLVESAVYKLRKHVEQIDDTSDEDEVVGDDFENLYKGEISKSGVPILPSKRARKIPEKIQVSKEDLAELQNSPEDQKIESEPSVDESDDGEQNVSLDNLKDEEIAGAEQEDSDTSNN
jgi:DNA-directed RNA polymerase subunit omega|tara:strand:+ start:1194 stop:1730 length:537 start_codon:yes stop_codon:yes gene_type:complete